MVRENYWKVWVVVLLALVGLRALTSTLSSSSPSPMPRTPQVEPSNANPLKTETPLQSPETKPKTNSGLHTGPLARQTSSSIKPGTKETPTTSIIQTQPPTTRLPANDGLIESRNSTIAPNVPAVIDNSSPNPIIPDIHKSYFTLGSTKEEVLRIQGTPKQFGEYEWSYGLSTVQFRNDRVVSWTIYAVNPLRVKMLPSAPVSGPHDYFTVGSSKDAVLAVQGTPTQVGDYEWSYGLSTVQFRNDLVVSWTIYAVNPLHARMVPSSVDAASSSYFTLGSTKDEVLRVQGTPSQIGDYEWGYGLSTVQFRDGRVVSWTTYSVNPLRAKKF